MSAATTVADHYVGNNLFERVGDGLASLVDRPLSAADLAPLDQFHAVMERG